jgi:hypothetical protein
VSFGRSRVTCAVLDNRAILTHRVMLGMPTLLLSVRFQMSQNENGSDNENAPWVRFAVWEGTPILHTSITPKGQPIPASTFNKLYWLEAPRKREAICWGLRSTCNPVRSRLIFCAADIIKMQRHNSETLFSRVLTTQ